MSPSKLRRSNAFHCKWKEKLDESNAQEYLLAAQKAPDRYHRVDDLEVYKCAACPYLHIGHRHRKVEANPVL